MKSWQTVRLIAGTFILMSLALGIEGSHRIRRSQSIAKRPHEVVFDGSHLAKARFCPGLLNQSQGLICKSYVHNVALKIESPATNSTTCWHVANAGSI